MMKTTRSSTQVMPKLESMILTVRGEKVIIDSDLAKIYGIPTFRFNEAVKRNKEKFPEDFMFHLTDKGYEVLTSHFAISRSGRGGRRTLPFVFTEHGAIMAANILNSKRAVQMSVFVVRAFVKMRGFLRDNRELSRKLSELERELKKRLDVHETAIVGILQRIMALIDPPALLEPKRRPIGFGAKED